MVNAAMVNGRTPYFPPPSFCESFLIFGQIPRFENPVKYTRIFAINQSAAWPPIPGERLALDFPFHTNNIPSLTLIQNIFAKILQNRKAPHPAPATVRRRERES
jgi:hypothetical protein